MYIILMKKINWLLALEQYKVPVCTVWPIRDRVTPLPFSKRKLNNCSSPYWLHSLVLAVFGDMLERAPSIRALTLADSVPSLHHGLPADFNSSCAIDNVLTCFSLLGNVLHYRLHFLPYCIEKDKRLGLLLHILSFYTFIFLEWSDSESNS